MASRKQWNEQPQRWHKTQKPLAREMRRVPTEAERLLWERLRRGQLLGLRFRRQHPIGPFLVDFFCSSVQLAVEVDGGLHSESDQAERDRLRSEGLQQAGVRVLRLRNSDILNRMGWVLELIASQVESP